MDNDIMKPETIIPPSFTGVFYFTNSWADKDFIGVWGKKEYTFPANSTSPMLIPDHSPLEIMQIRKKFAKDWAEQDFFMRNERYKRLLSQERSPEGVPLVNSFKMAGTYTIEDLVEGIQKCIQPLEIKEAFVQKVQEVPMEQKLSRNEDGELNTTAIDKKVSLKDRALKGEGTPQ